MRRSYFAHSCCQIHFTLFCCKFTFCCNLRTYFGKNSFVSILARVKKNSLFPCLPPPSPQIFFFSPYEYYVMNYFRFRKESILQTPNKEHSNLLQKYSLIFFLSLMTILSGANCKCVNYKFVNLKDVKV